MGRKKVLIVEDQPETVIFMRVALEHAGYEVFSAANGREGLEMADAVSPDLIVLDIMMPEMDGYTVNLRLKENSKTKKIPVIVSTARGMLRNLFGPEQDSRIDGYLTKPFDPAELTDLVGKILNKKK